MTRLKIILAASAAAGVIAYISCTPQKIAVETIEVQPLKIFSSETLSKNADSPKCKFMLDSYCNYLYSPDVLGNLEIKRAASSTKVLQGETENGISQVFYQYSRAKLRNQQHLPKDFSRVLTQYGYFKKLQEFLSRGNRSSMSVSQRLATEKLTFDLDSIWSASLNETVLSRMIQKYPGFHQIADKMIPIELSLDNRRVRRNLVTEISKAVWRDDKNWSKVEQGFLRLQKSYLRMLGKLDIPENTRQDWIQRISQVKLVLPGSFPAISDDECSTTTVNAYYYTYLNVLTVCAGDFNSEDIIQTLAHEMGHSLGVDRSQYLFETNSEFGKNLSQFRAAICEPKTFTCESWEKYKAGFDAALTSLDNFQPDVVEFQRCLKRRPTTKTLFPTETSRLAKNIVSDRISGLASTDRFLRITKSNVPTKNGKTQKNPNYLNPCSYSMWSHGEEPVDDELTTLMYFTAEYRCSDKSPVEKLKSAIELSKNMTTQLVEKALQIEGEFSSRSILESEGFGSPPFERFADVIGSYAMADYLSDIPNTWDRRNKFLASSSWQCLEPSLANHFPEESAIEKEYIFDSHTEGDQRRKELFSAPIREAISCDKDFEFTECTLPFKN